MQTGEGQDWNVNRLLGKPASLNTWTSAGDRYLRLNLGHQLTWREEFVEVSGERSVKIALATDPGSWVSRTWDRQSIRLKSPVPRTSLYTAGFQDSHHLVLEPQLWGHWDLEARNTKSLTLVHCAFLSSVPVLHWPYHTPLFSQYRAIILSILGIKQMGCLTLRPVNHTLLLKVFCEDYFLKNHKVNKN